MERCLEEVDMERCMKVLEQNQQVNEQINAHLNFADMQKAMKKGEFST